MISKKYKKVIFVIGLFFLVFAVSITLFNRSNVKRVQSHAQWAEHYESLEEMIDNTELIVIGEVVSSTPELRADLMHTVQNIKINKYIKDDKKDNGFIENDYMKVLQIGGEMEGRISREISEAPLFKKGEEYLLFVRKVIDGKPYYLVSGGYQGSAEITLFNKLKVILTDDDKVQKQFINKSASDIEKIVKDHLEEKEKQ